MQSKLVPDFIHDEVQSSCQHGQVIFLCSLEVPCMMAVESMQTILHAKDGDFCGSVGYK